MAGSPKKRARKAEEAARQARERGESLPAIAQARAIIARVTPRRPDNRPKQIPYMPDSELDEELRKLGAADSEPIEVDFEPVDADERIEPQQPKPRKKRSDDRVLTEAEQEQMLDLIERNAPIRQVRDELGLTRRQLYKYIHNSPEFADQYAKAKEASADYMASEMIALADSSLGLDAAGVQAIKLMVETRKWTAAKLKPKVYGDRVDMRLEAHVAQISDNDLNAQITALLGVQHSQQAATAEVNETVADE